MLSEQHEKLVRRGDAMVAIGNHQDAVLELLKEPVKGIVYAILIGPDRFLLLELAMLAPVIYPVGPVVVIHKPF
jgi:hypothetical protein